MERAAYTIWLALLCTLIFSSDGVILAQDRNVKEIQSEINGITVYLNGAQVNRTGRIQLDAGRNNVLFRGLTRVLDPQTVQLSGGGNFLILSLTHQFNYLEEHPEQEKLRELIARRDSLQKLIDIKNLEKQVLERELNILMSNTTLKGEQQNLTAQELKQAMEFFRSKLTEIENGKLDVENRLNVLNGELQKVKQQIAELNDDRSDTSSEITAVIDSPSSQTVTLDLSYVVRNAGWYPSYDIRVDDINSDLNLAYKANIYQSTGIDWKDVNLTVSSASPEQGARLPVMNPWFIDFYQPYQPVPLDQTRYRTAQQKGISSLQGRVVDAETNDPIPSANVLIKGTNTGIATNQNGEFQFSSLPSNAKILRVSFVGYYTKEIPINSSYMNITLEPGRIGLDELVVTGYAQESSARDEINSVPTQIVQNQTSFSYRIDLLYDINSGGKAQTVDINNADIPAQYRYFTSPKIRPQAYLTAQITDWEEYNLLPGQSNLFFEKTYVGKAPLNPGVTGDTLSFSLGKDPSISVNRKKLKEFEEKNFFGSKIRESFAWEIEIRNSKQQPVQIEVEDQVPISKNEDIKVELNERSGAGFNRETGRLVWNLNLKPGETRSVRFEYMVEYPKGKNVRM